MQMKRFPISFVEEKQTRKIEFESIETSPFDDISLIIDNHRFIRCVCHCFMSSLSLSLCLEIRLKVFTVFVVVVVRIGDLLRLSFVYFVDIHLPIISIVCAVCAMTVNISNCINTQTHTHNVMLMRARLRQHIKIVQLMISDAITGCKALSLPHNSMNTWFSD